MDDSGRRVVRSRGSRAGRRGKERAEGGASGERSRGAMLVVLLMRADEIAARAAMEVRR